MKLSCNQADLARGLQTAGRAVTQRSPLPITSNIMFETEGDRLKLSATNLEIAISTWIDASVVTAGRLTLPARLVTEFVNALPNEAVVLEVKEGTSTCHIRAPKFNADVRGIDADDFPRIPAAEGQATARLDSKLLREMIEQVAFAAASDDTRPVLTGVQCTFSGGSITMTAADSFRLAMRSGGLEADAEGDFGVIVPARTLNELSKILPEGDEHVAVTVTPNRNQIIFQADRLHVVSRLIEGSFPNVRTLIPTKFQTSVKLSTSDFLKATRVASFFSRDNSNMITVEVNPGTDGGGSQIVVMGAAAEVGENHGELDAHVEGDHMQVAFNARFMADALTAIQTPMVDFSLTGPTTAAVIRPDGADYSTYIVMPINAAG